METPLDEASAYASWIGRTFDDRYRLLRILGEGGMGAVFVAEQLRLRKEVAFKIIRPEIADDPKIAARFAREAMATAQIESPHIASAIDYGQLPEGGAYLVTQLARGRPLGELLRSGALPWARAAEIAAQIADALSTAHGLGIIHRDLKPDNIIVGDRDDGTPLALVLDFGIASLSAEATIKAPETSDPLTSFGLVLGTPGYMAPEQAVGDRIDARTDLYALGVILWESITGAQLWSDETLTGIVRQQMRSAAPSLRQVAGEAVPEALDALTAQLLERIPNKRPSAASEVRDGLRECLSPTLQPRGDLQTQAGAAASDTSLPTLPDSPQVTAPMSSSGPAHPRDRQLQMILGVCFVIGGALLLSAAYWYFSADDPAAENADSDSAEVEPKDLLEGMSIHDDEPKADDSKADSKSKDQAKAKDKSKSKSKSKSGDADAKSGKDDDFEFIKDDSGRMRMIRRRLRR